MTAVEANESSRARLLLRPFQVFFRLEAASGIILISAAAAALIISNSPLADAYFAFWQTTVTAGAGALVISKPLLLWINDGLMAVFFFVVGLEIKREILVGELASARKAALPLAAAVGGMVIPAALYAILNIGRPGMSGWGIPMATDIAFALGILALLGPRVPLVVKVFLTALAIVDDLGAVLVIAVFYTSDISWMSLGVASAFFAALVVANRVGAQRPLVFVILGAGLWVAFLKSGVHATIAGVLLALTVPARRRIDSTAFLARVRALVDTFASQPTTRDGRPSADQRDTIHSLEVACKDVEAPLTRFEHALHGWVAFAIMPIFALANAGVTLGGDFLSDLQSSVSIGIIAGLVVGKQLGVLGFAWVAVRSGLAEMPQGVSWRMLHGVSLLTGIGFTMSLFIAGLAFDQEMLLDQAKIGIFFASVIAGVGGYVLLRGAGPSVAQEAPAEG